MINYDNDDNIWYTNHTGIEKEDHLRTDYSTADLIKKISGDVTMLLLTKNKAYGDTANHPPNIFSKLTATEGILARIDDKLSRIKKLGFENYDRSEDTLQDLIGYLILLKVQLTKEQNKIKKTILDNKPKIK
jgi:hypothetical protein